MSALFLDACAVIYRVEAVAPFAVRLRDALAALRGAAAVVAVSDLSRLECRVRPMRDGRAGLVAAYDRFFAARGLLVVGLSPAVVDAATALRAGHGLRTPDALQAACCLSIGTAARFVTNDAGFRRVPGLDVVLI